MFTIYRLCAMDRCVDGIWGGILLKIDGKYEVIAGAPSEIYQYRKTIPILRRAIEAAGRPGTDHHQQCTDEPRHHRHVR